MSAEIDALNRGLRRSGQTVTLRKITGTAGLNPVDVDCLAVVRGYSPNELIGPITQQDAKVIIGPTEINNVGWPGVQVTGKADIRIPNSTRGDQIRIAGVWRAVQNAVGIYIGNLLVRIELNVR